ncbi:MAG: hypothetical protein OXG62_05985 [Nitrospinae bacterium]|nr:hypothetical protein [Nitrospinota bacterium]
MAETGCVACIDAIAYLTVSSHFMKKALQEVRRAGSHTNMTHEDVTAIRRQIEDLIGLESFCELKRRPSRRESGANAKEVFGEMRNFK